MAPVTAIVCAFGPDRVTRAALRRVRSLVDRVVVVPANRFVVDAVRGTPARTAAIGDVGSSGIRTAAAAAGTGPVVFLHDDVYLDRQSLGAMLAAATDTVVTAATNDVGTDHHVGSLPPVRHADRRLDARALDLRGGHAAVVRPSCLAGPGDRIAALAGRHLEAATTLLDARQEPMAVAPGAVAAHDGSCVRRLPDPIGPDGRALVVAAMIVRDEEAVLADCLRSVERLVDRVEVCDTGSVDRTREIARSFGATVTEREWRDDFGWARNEVLDRCRDAWFVLQIDADERLVCADPETVRSRLALAVDERRAFSIEIVNVDPDGREASRFRAARLFPAVGTTYVGALHETPRSVSHLPPLDWTPLDGVRIHHLGYAEQVVAGRDKVARNLSIAETAYEEDPSPEHALTLARALGGRDPSREDRLLTEVLTGGLRLPRLGRAGVLAMRAEARVALGRFEDALGDAEAALALAPADDRARRARIRAARRLGRVDEVLDPGRAGDPALDVSDLDVGPPGSHAGDLLDVGDLALDGGPVTDGAPADDQSRSRTVPERSQAQESRHLRDAVRAEEVAALVDAGRVDDAVAMAAGLLADAGEADGFWPELVGALVAADDLDRLRALVLADRSGAGLEAAARHVPPATVVEWAVSLVDARADAEAVSRVGLVAALVVGDDAAGSLLAVDAPALEPAVRDALAARARDRGLTATATALRPTTGHPQPGAAAGDGPILPASVLVAAAAVPPVLRGEAGRFTGAGRSPAVVGAPTAPPGWRSIDRSPRGAIRLLQPRIVVVDDPGVGGEVVTAMVEHSPGTILAATTASGLATVADIEVDVDDPATVDRLVTVLGSPPAVARPPAIPSIEPIGERTGVVSVVIPVFNNWDLTRRCLDALRTASDGHVLEVIVVDNASSDETATALTARPDVARVVTNDRNLGFAAAVNQGIAVSHGEFVCVLNNDTEPVEGWLDDLLAGLGVRGTGLVGPRTNRISGPQMVVDAPPLTEATRERAHTWAREWVEGRQPITWLSRRIVGFCFLARRATFVELGGLDAGVGLGNFEDDEWCVRVRRSGRTVRVADRAVVLHHGSATFKRSGIDFAASMLRGARHTAGRRSTGSDLACGVVLSDGQADEAVATAASVLRTLEVVEIWERADPAAVEWAAADLPAAATVRPVDWHDDRRSEVAAADVPAPRLVVLGAGERLARTDLASARAELERIRTPAGLGGGTGASEVRVVDRDGSGAVGGPAERVLRELAIER